MLHFSGKFATISNPDSNFTLAEIEALLVSDYGFSAYEADLVCLLAETYLGFENSNIAAMHVCQKTSSIIFGLKKERNGGLFFTFSTDDEFFGTFFDCVTYLRENL